MLEGHQQRPAQVDNQRVDAGSIYDMIQGIIGQEESSRWPREKKLRGGTETGQGPRSLFRIKENKGQILSPVAEEKKKRKTHIKHRVS